MPATSLGLDKYSKNKRLGLVLYSNKKEGVAHSINTKTIKNDQHHHLVIFWAIIVSLGMTNESNINSNGTVMICNKVATSILKPPIKIEAHCSAPEILEVYMSENINLLMLSNSKPELKKIISIAKTEDGASRWFKSLFLGECWCCFVKVHQVVLCALLECKKV